MKDEKSDRLIKVMLDVFQNELDSTAFEQLQELHPELRGLTESDARDFIEIGRTFDSLFGDDTEPLAPVTRERHRVSLTWWQATAAIALYGAAYVLGAFWCGL